MADKNDKGANNAPGKFYVDSSCIACGLCAESLPAVFKMDGGEAFAFVARQPEGDNETKAAEDVAGSCPVEAIGNDG
jgi:ferredoxin